MRKKSTIFIFFIFACTTVIAQQAPIYSQYVLNEFVINPSVAGLDAMTSINLTGRKQWFGWSHSPETYSVSYSTRILKSRLSVVNKNRRENKFKKGASGKVGLGASFVNDNNGAVMRTSLNLSYAYHIRIEESQLSFGLSLLAQQFRIDPELAQFSSLYGDDPLTGLLGQSTYIPDGGFGVNYSSSNYNIGFSIFQLFQSPIKFGEEHVNMKQLKQIRQYYLNGSYSNKFESNPKWEYEPALLLRATEMLQVSLDASLRFIYNREYWAGLSLRTSKDFILFMGIKLNRFYFGYSFDYGANEISRVSYGSHEVLMAIKLGDSTRRYRYYERY